MKDIYIFILICIVFIFWFTKETRESKWEIATCKVQEYIPYYQTPEIFIPSGQMVKYKSIDPSTVEVKYYITPKRDTLPLHIFELYFDHTQKNPRH